MIGTVTYNGFKRVLGNEHLGVSGSKLFYSLAAGNISIVVIKSRTSGSENKLTISDVITEVIFTTDFPMAIKLDTIT